MMMMMMMMITTSLGDRDWLQTQEILHAQLGSSGTAGVGVTATTIRGIYLLSIVGKIFARLILKLLQKLAERIYKECQYGFKSGCIRPTIDTIFSLAVPTT